MKYIKASSRGVSSADSVRFAGKEDNDCTVRALASANSMRYDKAHKLLKKFGRKDRKGAFFGTMLNAYNEVGFELKTIHGNTGTAKDARNICSYFGANYHFKKGITLGKLLPNLAIGNYIVNITGHAIAVVDGEIIDTSDNSANKRVIAVFKKSRGDFMYD